MADIIPFNGLLYNPREVNASLVMAPPYDIITPQLKEELYEKSPHNIVRIDFGRDDDGDTDDNNRYTRAAKFLADWLREGKLIRDSDPFFYCYEIQYEIHGVKKMTRGFFGAVRIEELGQGRVHPHEMTYSKPKSDRLNILRHCNANTSPIFSLYSSREKLTSAILEETVRGEPLIEAENGDGFLHRLWRISDSASIETIREELSDRDVFIADGHHRYETALAFQREMGETGLGKRGDEPFQYVLMFLSNMEEEGLTLLPTHRIIEIDSDVKILEMLREHFDIQKVSVEGGDEGETRRRMFRQMKADGHVFGLLLTGSNTYYVVSFNSAEMKHPLPPSLKSLDVSVLHNFIFEKLLHVSHFEYEMDPDVSVERARKGTFEAVFFLNPTRIHEVRDVALSGERMPPKSTYFFPKLLTGMVMYQF
jgi:uncharacterized protein (DUF1015 family)